MMFRQQERIGQEREEMEKQRRVLGKRKPTSAPSTSAKGTKNAKENDGFLRPADKPLVVRSVHVTKLCHLGPNSNWTNNKGRNGLEE